MKIKAIASIFILILALSAFGCAVEETPAPTPTPAPAPSPAPTPAPTPEPEPEPTPPPPEQIGDSDGRVTITLDKVERVDVMPSEFRDSPYLRATYSPTNERMSSVEWGGRPPPGQGYDFVAIYLTVARIEVEHMGYRIIGGAVNPEIKPSILIDLEENKYQEKAFTSRGVEFENLKHLTASYEFIEGTTMILIFELPKQAKPTILGFIYPFCESESWQGWEEKSIIEWGQIDLIL